MMEMKQAIKPLVITGPTGSGKTKLAVHLALALDGEIISCDSMQIYRGLDIGTAKATAAEQALVRHHLIDIVNPDESYSVARFKEDAMTCIEDICRRGKYPILCGGTGLYISTLVEGITFTEIQTGPELRARLQRELEQKGAEALRQELFLLDPETAAKIHPNNTKRLLRALEICRLTGQTPSEINLASRKQPSPYAYVVYALTHERSVLYQRINLRVDQMLQNGLIEEAAWLLSLQLDESATCRQAIGYKEIFPYIEGKCSLEEAAERLKQATRRYAKRQLTWFRAKPYVRWLRDLSTDKALEEIQRTRCSS
jgi:tRNA dimethylallyltransferase